MFTARAATNSTVVAEIADSTSTIILTRRVNGIASVGLNAIALVNDMYTYSANNGRQFASASFGFHPAADQSYRENITAAEIEARFGLPVTVRELER